jgi:hypothetical protein
LVVHSGGGSTKGIYGEGPDRRSKCPVGWSGSFAAVLGGEVLSWRRKTVNRALRWSRLRGSGSRSKPTWATTMVASPAHVVHKVEAWVAATAKRYTTARQQQRHSKQASKVAACKQARLSSSCGKLCTQGTAACSKWLAAAAKIANQGSTGQRKATCVQAAL